MGPSQNPRAPSTATTSAIPSAQMEAVMRVLTGQDERTLAQKLADPNRPTWEQYKKDNGDKLNLEGADAKKMEEYRQQLDAERDHILARGTNHKPNKSSKDKKHKKKKRKRHHSSDTSSEDDSDADNHDGSSDEKEKRKTKHKKRKKKHKKKHHRHRDQSSSSGGSDDDNEDDDASGSVDGDRKRKHKRKKKKRKKQSTEGDNAGNESDGSHYRLSKFFAGSDTSD